jgi:hypothetical protein
MKAERTEIDSRVFGRNVLSIKDFDPTADFAAFERDYVAAHSPVYVACKIPLERITDTHILERHGFNLIECQIKSAIKLRKPYDVSPFRQYAFERVTREEDLPGVFDIAATTFVHDRFSIDLALSPEISGNRYKEYVLKSFRSPDESVYRLVEIATGRTVAFKTHKRLNETEVLFLLGGVHVDDKNLGLGLINEYFEFNALIAQGVKRGVTHISAGNYPVFNLEIGNLGFRVMTTYAVMRKLYR